MVLQNVVQRVKFDGTNKTPVVPEAFLNTPSALAIDWVSRNLYWASKTASTIEVMSLDSPLHYRKVVLRHTGKDTGVASPVAMCVDPIRG